MPYIKSIGGGRRISFTFAGEMAKGCTSTLGFEFPN
jgi:hypothetical protein